MLRSIVLGWILIYRNWSIKFISRRKPQIFHWLLLLSRRFYIPYFFFSFIFCWQGVWVSSRLWGLSSTKKWGPVRGCGFFACILVRRNSHCFPFRLELVTVVIPFSWVFALCFGAAQTWVQDAFGTNQQSSQKLGFFRQNNSSQVNLNYLLHD